MPRWRFPCVRMSSSAGSGDMLRVPGSAQDTLLKRRGKGGDVRICLSVSDAIRIAQAHPHQQVVFLGVGFETTAPGTAAAILEAEELGLDNFSVLSLLRKSEPAIRAIVHEPGCAIDGFLCPGHVAAIIGEQGFRFLKEECHRSGVICGFEPEDILYALSQLIDAVSCGRVILENAYARLVRPQGNIAAMALMDQVFEPEDALWRGLGVIAQGGMKIKAKIRPARDARVKFHLPPFADHEPPGCCCAQVISGKMAPRECPLFSDRRARRRHRSARAWSPLKEAARLPGCMTANEQRKEKRIIMDERITPWIMAAADS